MIIALCIIAYILLGIGSVMLMMYIDTKEYGYASDDVELYIILFLFWPLIMPFFGIMTFFEWYKDKLEENTKEDDKE